jgi:hypothetical protein
MREEDDSQKLSLFYLLEVDTSQHIQSAITIALHSTSYKCYVLIASIAVSNQTARCDFKLEEVLQQLYSVRIQRQG